MEVVCVDGARAEAEIMTDRDGHGRFLTGNSGGGRPRGARNKLSEDFLQKLAADFEAHGSEVIAWVREEYPHHYLRVVGALMTKQIDAKTDHRAVTPFAMSVCPAAAYWILVRIT